MTTTTRPVQEFYSIGEVCALTDLKPHVLRYWESQFRFLNPANPANGNVFELEMSPGLFSLKDAGKTLKINKVWLLARCADPGTYAVLLSPPLPPPPPPGSNRVTLAKVNQYGGLHFSQRDVSALGIEVTPTGAPLQWSLRMSRPGGGNLQPDAVTNEMEVEDLMLIVGYEWEP